MPTRVLLEGPAIEPLLAQVRQEYGTAARIISADKVRRGGLGGFFAKEHYELSVEIDDDSTATGMPGDDSPMTPAAALLDSEPTNSGRDMDSLMEMVEASQKKFREKAAEGMSRRNGRNAIADAPAEPVREPVTAGAPVRAGVVSTANPGFAEVLAGLRGGLREDPAPVTMPTGFSPAAAVAEPTTTGRPSPYETMTRTATGGNAATFDMATSAPGMPMPHAEAAPMSTPGSPAAPGSTAFPNSSTASPSAETMAGAPCAADLIKLGVPADLAWRSSAPEPYRAALQALATIPPAPPLPTEPGDILVIVGELTYAMEVAKDAATAMRLGPSRMYVVCDSLAGTGMHASRRIANATQAARKAAELRTADSPNIVVVDVPLTGRPAGWVDDMCEALEASDVWAVVDASRKLNDTANHLVTMGQIDAIALYGMSTTTDPASPLELELPIAMLDGRPATSHVWASMLAERLGATPLPRRRRRRPVSQEDA